MAAAADATHPTVGQHENGPAGAGAQNTTATAISNSGQIR